MWKNNFPNTEGLLCFSGLLSSPCVVTVCVATQNEELWVSCRTAMAQTADELNITAAIISYTCMTTFMSLSDLLPLIVSSASSVTL